MAIVLPKILPHDEIIAMRPQDRDRYVEKAILSILDVNPRGVTISDITSRTGFDRRTVAKHLKRLIATREGYFMIRGNVAVYYKNGQVVHAADVKDTISANRKYTLYRLENEDGKFIYIQEKEIDEFRAVRVKGGIMIDSRFILPFIQELQNFVQGAKAYE